MQEHYSTAIKIEYDEYETQRERTVYEVKKTQTGEDVKEETDRQISQDEKRHGDKQAEKSETEQIHDQRKDRARAKMQRQEHKDRPYRVSAIRKTHATEH